MSKIVSIVLAAALIAQAALSAAAQQATPTPAPTKTPTLTAAIIPTLEVTPEAGQLKSLAQADLAVLTGNVQKPNGFAWFNNKLYTACSGDGTVYEIDDTTGSTKAYIYGIKNAQTLYVENDANNVLTLWVPDYEANVLTKVTRNRVETVARNLNGPWGISYVDEQHFLVTNLLSNSINLLSRDGDNQVLMDNLSAPMGVVHDDQTLYIANYGSTRRSVEWYDYQAVAEGTQDSDSSVNHVLVKGLQNTTDVQLGTDGYLYFAYALGNRGLVGRVDPAVCKANGGCTNDQVEIVLFSDLDAPLAGLTITPDMRMFVHTMFKPEIYWAKLDAGE
ncbi:MAG: hypothetical protein ABI700_14395 [Chloroflexota bacterium]